MLGKLVKYDMLALSPVLVIFHIPFVVLTVVARFLGVERLLQLQKPDLPAIMVLVLYFIYASFISLATELYFAVYVYRSWFSREGYLTMTLPVSPALHTASRLLSGCLWFLADYLLLFFSFWFLASAPGMEQLFGEEYGLVMDFFSFFNPSTPGFYLTLALLSGVFSGTAMIMGVLCAGHCFPRNRVLSAIIIYFGITLVIQLVAGAAGALASLRYAPILEEMGENLTSQALGSLVNPFLLVVTVCSLLFGAACLAFSHYVIKRRLNLD